MIGERLSHYLIEERLGKGGMGEVFLARDLALGRPAAIKILPTDFSPELRRRLLSEAEASRRLQHPGIATFFEAGSSGATDFIAMEYVRGETLRKRLRGGPLPQPAALAITAGLLEALGHAHRAGVIHRDIKPENIMLTAEGAAKLLDFGLARRVISGSSEVSLPTRTQMTEAGTVLGSIGYMAPEQLRAEATDARTDLFAVGGILYEMLAGRPAFPGVTAAERIAATLFRDVSPLPETADGANWIVRRALARVPDQRYASAAEFLRDLRRLGEGDVVAAYPDTVAVLDFENRSGKSEDSWIGGAFAESLSADLGRFEGVGIVPRPKVLKAIPGGGADPTATGAMLGCRWVLSGSYQKMGEALRVLMHVTHVPTESVALTEKLDGVVGDIFAIQDRLGASASGALRLGDRTAARAARAAPALGAYECYTRGMEQWARLAKGGFDQAEELFREALRQQPDYPDALAGLAAVHDMRFTFTTDPAELSQALVHARRAVELDANHGAARVWLAYAQWRSGDGTEALATATRAGELDPHGHYPPYFAAAILHGRLDLDRANQLYQRAVERGPVFGFAWVGLGCTHMELGRFDEAEWSIGKAIELERSGIHSTAGSAGFLGECLRRESRLDEARRQCLDGLESVERSDHMVRDSIRAVCLNVLGRTALDQGDRDAARTAFHQSEQHLEGRPRTLGGGHLYCQAIAGRASAEGDAKLYARARELFERRAPFDWSWFFQCSEDVTRSDLERAATAVRESG
jgi:TolB-like protein/Tfp pilus assembly protein PilF/predicted Ser/Thr protein kinase